MFRLFWMFFIIQCSITAFAQSNWDSLHLLGDVRITIDKPAVMHKKEKNLLVIYALPNGNTTEQTMGKKMQPGDDWHYDIQHISAQTKFIRSRMKENIIVAYLENSYHSWPQWKAKHPRFRNEIPLVVDSLRKLLHSDLIYLNGHSGGGSFIFGFLDAFDKIPSTVRRISFIDSDYGYDSSYTPKIIGWLQQNKLNTLTVFAYNDSVALYNGKPVVSEKGGTWYRSHLMMEDLKKIFVFSQFRNDSLIGYQSKKGQVVFYFRTNPDRKIYHTQQVEYNGFIHSILYRTKNENEGYEYYGQRAYATFIE